MVNLKEILGKFPLFSSLDRKAIEEFSQLAVLQQVKKDEIIYRENDPADNFYLVISGRIKTYTKSSLKEGRALEYLYRGTCFGIISLLTDEPHSVTAQAVNDSVLVAVEKDKFDKFLKKYPSLALELSKILSRRVKKREDKGKNIFESSIIGVYSLKSKIGKTTYSLSLAQALNIEAKRKTIVVEVKKNFKNFYFPQKGKPLNIQKFKEANLVKFLDNSLGFDYLKLNYQFDTQGERRLIPVFLTFLTQSYNFIILDLPSELDSLVALCLNQADFLHFLILASLKMSDFVKELNFLCRDYRIAIEKIKIILKEDNIHPQIKFTQDCPVFATLPVFKENKFLELFKEYPKNPYLKSIRRIAREISSVRVGLALGSGAAYGLAHIGVFKALEENNVNIDIVSGSSMGSIIAGLWGLGMDWVQMRELALKFKDFPIFSFLDIGFSGKSFLKGHYLKRILKKIFGDKRFYDLKRPIRIVCFDFKKRKPYVLSRENFSLYRAILASCSIPGIFAPVENKEDLLLDGGVLNPLPVGCLIKEGIKKIISVNVSPSGKDIEKMYREQKIKKLNIFDFIFGSIEAMQQEFIQEAISLSDIVIHPKFENMLWTDFKNVDYFIAKGEEETLKHLNDICQLEGS